MTGDKSAVINMNAFAEMEDLMEDEFTEWLEQYLFYSRELINEIDNSIKEANIKSLHRAAHKLKPTNLQVGMSKLHQLACQLETTSHIDQSKRYFDAFCKEFALVSEFVESKIS